MLACLIFWVFCKQGHLIQNLIVNIWEVLVALSFNVVRIRFIIYLNKCKYNNTIVY